MRLYEQAIRSAREHGFVQNEGLANELAARFYAARGFETIAHAYLRDARHCYLRWGADGKVRQLDQLYPHFAEEAPAHGSTSTIVASAVEHLDLATVDQGVASRVGRDRAREADRHADAIALEHAGAERGLLILPRGTEQRIEAEATTGGDAVDRPSAPRRRGRGRAARVDRPLCHPHAGERDSRRRLQTQPVLRRRHTSVASTPDRSSACR